MAVSQADEYLPRVFDKNFTFLKRKQEETILDYNMADLLHGNEVQLQNDSKQYPQLLASKQSLFIVWQLTKRLDGRGMKDNLARLQAREGTPERYICIL